MKTKVKRQISETFTADSVSTSVFGAMLTFSRSQCEYWLSAMDMARAREGQEACRKAVGQAIEATRKLREDRGLKIEDGSPSSIVSLPSSLRTTAAILCLLSSILVFSARASEIIRGYTPQDGQQLYAADLENLVDESTIGAQFYGDKANTPILGAGYEFLIYDPSSSSYYTMNGWQVLYGNTNLFTDAYSSQVNGNDLMLFYAPSNAVGNQFCSTTVSNFLWNSSSNINVAELSFANTNNTGATYAYVLPKWPYPALSGLNPNLTNYPAHFIVFDTNGIPYRVGISNLDASLAYDFGNDFGIPYEYQQEFLPWTIYGTNTVSPYTNAWGLATNFPIVSYYQTNAIGTNIATLTDTDTIPVNAYQQAVVGTGAPTNTAATLLSIYEYMTNKNALPPYTIARAQFSGVPDTFLITNMASSLGLGSGIITNFPDAVNWSNYPVAVSFMGASSQMPTEPAQITSNTVYYAYQTNWPNLGFQLFTNLAQALARTNPIYGNGVKPQAGSEGTMYWLTNYTSVNCDVIQESGVSSINTGVYSFWFRTPSATPYYYVTGTAQSVPGGSDSALVSLSNTALPTTNSFNIRTSIGYGQNFTIEQPPLVQVLIYPQ